MHMIKSFKHKGLQNFYHSGSKAGIQAAHEKKLGLLLTALNVAESQADLNPPNWGLHQLKGKLDGYWSLTVSGNWRIIFKFEDKDVILVDYLDYH